LAYSGTAKRIMATSLATIKLCELRKSHIQNWIWEISKKYPMGTTPRTTWQTLKQILLYAADEERQWVLAADVIMMFHKLDKPKRVQYRPHVTEDDIQMFIGHITQITSFPS
jgi:hypothetical protein